MKKIRVLLADDQVLFVESLRTVLETRAEDFEVVGIAFNGREAVEQVMKMQPQPDLILMDVRMPEMDGVQATRIIHEAYPSVHVMMLTTFDDDTYVVEALNHGAAGYMLKDIPPNELIVALRAVCNGSVIISPLVANKLLRMKESDPRHDESTDSRVGASSKTSFLRYLSRREIEILQLIGKGHDNALIARKLNIAEQTVKNHVSVIYSKLNLHNRVQVMKLATSLRDYIETE